MRLVCPNCDAQYEVPDQVIPEGGRDVQCSDCGNTWFFRPGGATGDVPDEGSQAPDTATAAAPRSTVTDEVAEILRSEAEHEAKARAREAQLAAAASLAALREGKARKPVAAAASAAEPAKPGSAPPDPSEKDSPLPDVNALTSTLKPRNDAPATQMPDAAPAPPPERQSGDFWTGFLLVVFVAVLAVSLYTFAPQIAEALPWAARPVTAYTEWIDAMRAWLNAQVAVAPPSSGG